ncbi:MAG TPA: hypothetical protein VFD63_22445 [Pyrinomonadaceae bacterium]|nr:hypothetical protein [Pyrinomonadaceae bacterium]
MKKFEHRVVRVQVLLDGDEYYLGSMVQKDERFPNVDHLGENGWEFVAFVPNPEVYLSDSFTKETSSVCATCGVQARSAGEGVKGSRFAS